MSSIASFKKVNKAALEGLAKAATPRRTFFGGTKDEYPNYLSANATDVARYEWSGFVLATLLPYLEERYGIDLMHSEHNDLADLLTNQRQATCFIFTDTHRANLLDRLKPEEYPIAEMRDYFNEFNASDEQEIGIAMRDGIKAIRDSLAQVDPQSVVLLSIG